MNSSGPFMCLHVHRVPGQPKVLERNVMDIINDQQWQAAAFLPYSLATLRDSASKKLKSCIICVELEGGRPLRHGVKLHPRYALPAAMLLPRTVAARVLIAYLTSVWGHCKRFPSSHHSETIIRYHGEPDFLALPHVNFW